MAPYANAPAAGEGVGVQLPGRNIETPTDISITAQVLSARIGLSPAIAKIVAALLRGEPYDQR